MMELYNQIPTPVKPPAGSPVDIFSTFSEFPSHLFSLRILKITLPGKNIGPKKASIKAKVNVMDMDTHIGL